MPQIKEDTYIAKCYSLIIEARNAMPLRKEMRADYKSGMSIKDIAVKYNTPYNQTLIAVMGGKKVPKQKFTKPTPDMEKIKKVAIPRDDGEVMRPSLMPKISAPERYPAPEYRGPEKMGYQYMEGPGGEVVDITGYSKKEIEELKTLGYEWTKGIRDTDE